MEQIGTSHEEQVIGAALAESGHWLAHAARLSPDLFVTYPALARELLAMTAEGHPTDPKSVQTWLFKNGWTEAKISNLLRLEDQAPFGEHAMAVAVEALHERAKRNALQKLSVELQQRLREPGAKADDLIGRGFKALTDIAERSSINVLQIGSVLNDVVKNLGRPQQGGVKSGILPIDSITHGLKGGELVVLGARPSMGKTALALGISARASMDGGVLLFSLEMSTKQLCQRLLSMLSAVNLARIVTHRVSTSDVAEITEAANVAHRLRLYVCEDTDHIEATCRQMKHRHGLSLVVVDYLQLMSCRAESREQQIATLSRKMKQMARRLDVPVLVLSQLNRSVEARTCKRPQLSDLRESGAIEQDADQVWLLWRPAYYDDAEDPTEAELILAKNRNGPTGAVELTWVKECARFSGRKQA